MSTNKENIQKRGASTRFKKGTQVWKLRSKHGRDKLFKTPDLMLEAALEFIEMCENNPLLSVEYHGKKRVNVPKMRVPTWEGLCIYIRCSSSYFRKFKSDIENKEVKKPKDEAFLDVIEQIHDLIYNQKYTGAAAGMLNATLIIRDLKLVDRTEANTNNTNNNFNHNSTPMTKEEMRDIAKELEDEY